MIESLVAGSTIRETYTVLEKLGEGAFSEVFLVRHRFLGLQAMKVFKRVSLSDTGDQFKEAFLLSRVGHPNVIRIFEANKIQTAEGERCYLTMEYAAGGTLNQYLASSPQLPVDSVVAIQKQICAGLSTAHGQDPPIVHRDIKPQNMLVAKSQGGIEIKIADFGLARNIDPKLRMASAAGTLLYMPPEGFLHYETPASDVYSAGIIFYEMLTGTFPFPPVDYMNEQEFRVALARSRASLPARPSTVRKEIHPELEDVCLKALQPDMRKRFQSAMEFLAALEALETRAKPVRSAAPPPPSRSAARDKATKAIEIGRQYAELPTAINMLEQAIQEDPSLRAQYEVILAKWKSGVVL